ncbi:MAG TPA: hypothetical protein VER17_09385, partial [Tepidisphaeraceae bacterium]|nr:hypothetical protein [Tepidisphaeraceae bacterium]
MKLTLLAFPLCLLILNSVALPAAAPAGAGAGEWKPAKAPLMTRFAKDVRPDNVLPEYPRPQMVRSAWLNLNGLWQFAPAGDGVAQPPIGKDLPGQILVPFPVESALSGVGKHSDKVWYRRTVEIPPAWKGKRVLLHFGAVDYESIVWVNGKEMGRHVGGYDGFSYDVTDALKGDGGAQEIIVGVTDATAETQPRGKQVLNPHGIWYTPVTGIWQTVWLEPVAQKSIRRLTITPDVDNRAVKIKVDAPSGTTVRAEVLDGADIVDAAGFPAGAEGTATVERPDRKPKLWSPEAPFLYGLKVTLSENGEVVDSIESYFGLRKIEVAPDEKGTPRIKLNGKAIMSVGPLDQGWWPDGLYTAPTDEALKYDLDVTQKLGFNTVRKHVKVEPQRWYYHADRMGLLVWQDMPNAHAYEAGAWQEQFEKE